MRSHRAESLFASAVEAPALNVPEDKRLPFEFAAFPVLPDGTVTRLYWPDRTTTPLESRLRVMIALDVREEVLIEVLSLASQQVMAVLDIRYAYVCQPFELMLNTEQTAAVLNEGVGLRMAQGTQAIWFFNEEVPDTVLYRPHLLTAVEGEPLQHFYQRLNSLDTLQPFGWMEGCVLDALLDLGRSSVLPQAQAPLTKHLQQFFDRHDRLLYEDPRSRPTDDRIYGIEGTLPFAAVAEIWPQHPALDQVIAFWRGHLTEQGAIQDGGTLSAEGCYTVAYPLAVIACQRQDHKLLALALKQLVLRRDYLIHNDGLYLRYHHDESRTFRNWSRGCAWYMLGLVRTLTVVGDAAATEELSQQFQRVAAWVTAYARPDGLWACFVDEGNISADTSGSAGIAAALALGVKSGLLDVSYKTLAAQTFETLQAYLTPDGFLTGVAQANRGGEALQRSEYRVISQMGMGLMGQLAAAL